MIPRKSVEVIRLKRKTAEDVALWASALNMSNAEIVELAISCWLQLRPSEAFGLVKKDTPNA